MPEKILRWGLMSTARINSALIPPINASPRSTLLAIASRSVERARAYAKEWKIPKYHGSYKDLLADREVDAVYISLPNSLHAEWTVRALKAGKHVLCEKPLAITMDQVEAMLQAAENSGRILTEAFMYRHHPQTLKVKELVEAGAIGGLQIIKGQFSFQLENAGDVRLDSDLGGGALWDVGCYPVSYAQYILGTGPVEVFGWQDRGDTKVDLSFVGQMRYAGNIFAQFDCSFQSPLRKSIRIIGTEGSIEILEPFKPGIEESITLTQGDKVEQISIPGQELYLGEVKDIEAAALDGTPSLISLKESHSHIATLLTLYQSARERKPLLVLPD